MSLISRRRQKTMVIREDSRRTYILPDIGSRNLATREEIYGTYLAANANAPLPRLTVPRGIVVSSPNGIPNGDAYHWPAFPAKTFRYGNQFRRVAPTDSSSVNRHRSTNTSVLPISLSFFCPPSVYLVLFEPTLFNACRISLYGLRGFSFRYLSLSIMAAAK